MPTLVYYHMIKTTLINRIRFEGVHLGCWANGDCLPADNEKKLEHPIKSQKKKTYFFKTYIPSTSQLYGSGSKPITINFSGMNIHLPAILMFTRGIISRNHTNVAVFFEVTMSLRQFWTGWMCRCCGLARHRRLSGLPLRAEPLGIPQGEGPLHHQFGMVESL